MGTDIGSLFTALSQRAPKENLAVFIGRIGGRFMDNTKYLFRHCVQTEQPFSSVFLTHHADDYDMLRDAGLPCLMFPSEEAIAMLPRAKAVVCDDFWWRMETPARFLLSGAQILQLWHGIPLKLIGMPEAESAVSMDAEKRQMLRAGYSGYDAVVSTSPFVTGTGLGRAFACDEIWETGYPRNDMLFRTPDAIDMLGVDREAYDAMERFRGAGFKTVFYMPTFRDTGGDAFENGALDLERLDIFCRRQKIAFFFKFHPYVDVPVPRHLKAVHSVQFNSDAYPLLAQTDCLLTDYSSVAYDFLLTGRPVVFFPYDLEKYLACDRAMFYRYEDMSPGPRPVNEPELFEALFRVCKGGEDPWREERNALCAKLFSACDGHAAGRVARLMRSRFFAGGA
ncbi:CDP-glycerol:poly(glycerophosphate) glycerophosphotransferase [Oleidesulfovibrio alaskensis G20]|uniref:CDP-glycerol:poly(Glycerophosphate) glycerophosphotransferase n=1 Tax=Oleidesulfovibrio alaskensis (strain ATCC BAA-1058 / DSM 17464 / G20) TaxID=207559 RepID=Q316A6_OLEA2|nr:CDP-glycerol--poly(glycerophosphate) glycerophosphotransferase [Oleidesulfovibrio alaskensis]ABB37240.1 CDP-glycerol:poly(glycerophosphate) glycerophosphotransferase [Oleidesulfovibrio alaskensis G20]MBG0772575.1 CDP-glycerol--poly(glycerophosphate) glycerophosphotransferase [Oleidesulfovibrio alaskensis]